MSENQTLKKQNNEIANKHKEELKKVEEARQKEKSRAESHIHK